MVGTRQMNTHQSALEQFHPQMKIVT
jgi:hypothetical protein